jgi:hypothetical protein
MAKKNTTPESILTAPPIPEPTYLIRHEGLNRQQRRMLEEMPPATNKVYRRTLNG